MLLSAQPFNAEQLNRLIQEAHEAYHYSYTPYSQFPVGAALLVEDGSVVQGCNVENASFGLAICAERAAIVKAISMGHKHFEAIAIVAEKASPCYPCGTCLQFIREFGPDIQVILERPDGPPLQVKVSDMLPYAFTADDLKG